MNKAIAIPSSAKRTDHFIPPSLEGTPRALTFEIRIPTPSERDTIGTRLYELGLSPIGEETMRATIIDELYKVDWSDLASPGIAKSDEDKAFFNETYADMQAEMLDGYWDRHRIEDVAAQLWQEQEAQRLLDEGGGAPKREPAPAPAKLIKIREHAQVKLLLDELTKRSQRIRTLTSERMDYGRKNAEMMIRIQVANFTPVDQKEFKKEPGAAKLDFERDHNGLMTAECVDQLREFIGNTAWYELVQRTDGHFSLEETERKNSDSPPGKPSDQTGSHEPSGASETRNGDATASSTGPIPDAGSETITARSSPSASDSEEAKSKPGQTAAA